MKIHHEDIKNTKPLTEMRSTYCLEIILVCFVTLWWLLLPTNQIIEVSIR